MPAPLFVASTPRHSSLVRPQSAFISVSTAQSAVRPTFALRKRSRQLRFGQTPPWDARRRVFASASLDRVSDDTPGGTVAPSPLWEDGDFGSVNEGGSVAEKILGPNSGPTVRRGSALDLGDEEDQWVVPGSDKRTLFLVDAFGLLFRSYYALAKTTMSSRDMFDTRAVYGFTMVMLSFLKKHAKGNPVAVVFEGRKLKGQKDFRTAVYPEYKEGRGPTPTGIIEAIPWAKRMCKILGLAVLEVDLYEADDTIGTLVRKARSAGVRSVIVSMDKDFRQLLEDGYVKILRPGAGGSFEDVTEESFRKDYEGLHPRQYVDVLTLIGDKADGLRGVPGIGTRTAPRLIAQYGTVEELLSAIRKYFEEQAEEDAAAVDAPLRKTKAKKASAEGLPLVTKRIASSLRDNEQHALLVKTLITIRTKVPLPGVSWESIQRKPVDEEDAREVLRLLEFTNRNMLAKVLESADNVFELKAYGSGSDRAGINVEGMALRPTADRSSLDHTEKGGMPPEPLPDEKGGPIWTLGTVTYMMAPTMEEIDRELLGVSGVVGVVPVISKVGVLEILTGIALCTEPGNGILINLGERGEVPESVASVLCDASIEKRGWFLKKAYKLLLERYNIRLGGKLFDNRIASELLHAGESITDARLASLYLGSGALDNWISGRDHRISTYCPAEDALPLCDTALRLAEVLNRNLDEEGLQHVLTHVELPLIPVLGDMERTGVPINSDGLQSFERHVRHRLDAIVSRLKDLVPPSADPKKAFRPSSRDDVAKLVFETWGINLKVKKTSSGRFPVDKKVLTRLAEDGNVKEEQREFAKLMLEYREAAKILSTYTKSLLSAVDSDGRIRATFVQEAAATGRLSTSNPNLQSIPIRSSLGREVRSLVQPPPGFCILCADYSQIELRIIASLSEDRALREAFQSGTDVHRAVAARVFKLKSSEEVTDEQRRNAKEVNYGIPYGITSYGLGQHLGISSREAKALMSQFHGQFPDVKRFTEKLIKEARNTGFAKTVLGRRLPLPLIRHGGPAERKAAERVAVNMPIQGTQADMIKVAMIRIAERLRYAQAKSRLILQIHDELVVEVHESELNAVKSLVEEEMVSALPLAGVDVVVNTGIGDSWLRAAHG